MSASEGFIEFLGKRNSAFRGIIANKNLFFIFELIKNYFNKQKKCGTSCYRCITVFCNLLSVICVLGQLLLFLIFILILFLQI